jgi:hypothetical protein
MFMSLSRTSVRAFLDPAAQGVADHVGLLVDFLQHEMGIALLLGGRIVPVHVLDLELDRVALEVFDLVAIAADFADLAVVDIQHVAGVLHDGGHVGPMKASPSPSPQ